MPSAGEGSQTRNSDCGLRNERHRLTNVKCGMRIAECEMQKAECALNWVEFMEEAGRWLKSNSLLKGYSGAPAASFLEVTISLANRYASFWAVGNLD